MLKGILIAVNIALATTTAFAQSASIVPEDLARPDGMSAVEQMGRLEDEFGNLFITKLSIDTPQCSVGEYVDLIHSALGFDFIVLDDSVRELNLPKISLTQVSLLDAIQLIEIIDWSGQGQIMVNTTSSLASVSLVRRGGQEPARPITLSLRPMGQPDFNITPVIEAVDAAARFLADESLRISVHEGSGVLFARGSEQAINLIFETVEQVHAMNSSENEELVEELFMTIEELHMRLDELEQRNDELMMAIEEERFDDEEEEFDDDDFEDEDEDEDEFIRR